MRLLNGCTVVGILTSQVVTWGRFFKHKGGTLECDWINLFSYESGHTLRCYFSIKKPTSDVRFSVLAIPRGVSFLMSSRDKSTAALKSWMQKLETLINFILNWLVVSQHYKNIWLPLFMKNVWQWSKLKAITAEAGTIFEQTKLENFHEIWRNILMEGQVLFSS